MCQGLIDRNSPFWIKCEHPLDHVNGVLICSTEQLGEVFATVHWQLAHEGAIVIIFNLVDQGRFWFSNQVCNHHHLLLLSLGGEQRFAPNELSQYAAHTPNVNSCSVLSPRQDHLWRSVPPCRNIVGKGGRWRHEGVNVGPCQSKVTNFQIAVAVDKQIPWLQVPMQNSTRMDIFESSQNLVKEELDVFIAENLIRLDNLSKISLHKIGHNVQFIEILERLRLEYALH